MVQEELEKVNRIFRDITMCKRALSVLTSPELFSLGIVKFGSAGCCDIRAEIPIQLKSGLQDMISDYLKDKEAEFKNLKITIN